jgi:hypothetical protein
MQIDTLSVLVNFREDRVARNRIDSMSGTILDEHHFYSSSEDVQKAIELLQPSNKYVKISSNTDPLYKFAEKNCDKILEIMVAIKTMGFRVYLCTDDIEAVLENYSKKLAGLVDVYNIFLQSGNTKNYASFLERMSSTPVLGDPIVNLSSVITPYTSRHEMRDFAEDYYNVITGNIDFCSYSVPSSWAIDAAHPHNSDVNHKYNEMVVSNIMNELETDKIEYVPVELDYKQAFLIDNAMVNGQFDQNGAAFLLGVTRSSIPDWLRPLVNR